MTRSVNVLIGVVALAGCAVGGSSIVAPLAVQSVTVTPSTLTILAGGTAALVANVSVTGGASQAVSWTSSDPSIALIAANGQSASIVGLKVGTARITATSLVDASKSNGADVIVGPGALSTIELSANASSLITQASLLVQAVGRDARGNAISGLALGWTSSNTQVATVSPSGLVAGLSPGTVTILASSGGVTSNPLVLTVTTPPVLSITLSAASTAILAFAPTPVQAVALGVGGVVVNGAVLSWTSSNPLVASVSPSGVVTGLNPGSVTITAASGAVVSNGLTFTITNPPVASITLTAATTTVLAFSTLQVQAVARDAAGNALSSVPFLWASNNTAIATVSNSGFVTGVSPGVVGISVTSGSVTSNLLAITVVNPPITSITVAAATASVSVNATLQATAVARDAGGNILSGVPLAWASSNALIASVSTTGLITGRVVGAVTITATSGSVTSNNFAVTVKP